MLERRGFPASILGQKKQGFTFPIARWLKTSLRGELDLLRAEPEAWSGGLLDGAYVRRLIDDHLAGRGNNYRILFNLLVFRHWRGNFPTLDFARP